MNRALFLSLFCLLSAILTSAVAQKVPLKKYYDFAKSSADWAWDNYDDLEVKWADNLDVNNIFGYNSPGHFLEMATIYAQLYEITGKKEYAKRARFALLKYPEYATHFPEEIRKTRPDYTLGTPPLPNFFTTMRYIRPYHILKTRNFLSDEDDALMTKTIKAGLDFLLQTQEWGPMNRSALRMETLGWALTALPDHPDASKWVVLYDALKQDNWGNWEIEDATVYHPVWLYALMGTAEASGETEKLFKLPEMYYYSHYFVNLMAPDGMIPDFGDARYLENWSRYLVWFEGAAKQYNSAENKWAAETIANRFLKWENIHDTGLAIILLDCYLYGSDDIVAAPPEDLSSEVMEDIQGKKVVFRNGWDESSTYMLLNYKDEGDGGVVYKDYLRDMIPVEEEKMTHGHADENSIPFLMYKGSVLLHDGGYRDYMPSGINGAYRADYFHNRLCVRPYKIFFGQKEGEFRYSLTDHPAIPGQSIWDFMQNAGSYRKVTAQKIDFLSYPDFDYSRTRLNDDKMGYQWDRVVFYIKDPECFVVFDMLKATTEGFKTAALLWFTQHIYAQGESWYDTRYDSIRDIDVGSMGKHCPDLQQSNLLIAMPKTHYRFNEIKTVPRHYQEEKMIAQFSGQYFELGQTMNFVTVLYPHSIDVDPEKLAQSIELLPYDDRESGLGIILHHHNNQKTYVGVKTNLRMDMVRDYRRPKYTYESGRISLGPVESNADFFVVHQGKKLRYTFGNLTRAYFKGKLLFEQAPNFFGLTFDGSKQVPDVGKARVARE